MFKKFSAAMIAIAVLLMPAIANAHVSVEPGRVSAGDIAIFSVNVPNERDAAITNIKLDIPKGLNDVTPTLKTGWTIKVDPTSITWSDGSIGDGFRDDFTFSAQAPAKSTQLNWKAHETYSDGFVASWDQSPDKQEVAGSSRGRYSVTKISNVSATDSANSANKATASGSNTLPLVFSLLAMTISFGVLLFKKGA